MNVAQAAKVLGGDVVGSHSILCPGPNHSPRDRSLSVTFADGRLAVHSHAGDDWRQCKDYVRARLSLPDDRSQPEYVAPIPVTHTTSNEERERTKRAIAIWQEAKSITGSPVEAYLTRRGVTYHGSALRWHPSCPFGKQRVGCIVALVSNIVTNEPQAVHRTALDQRGNKLSDLGSNGRLSLGPVAGGAVKLTDDEAVTTVIAIGEGIETSLSIRELEGLSGMPVWSVLSAGGIKSFPALPGIECVWIAADNDPSQTGERAALTAAERLNAANVETIVLAPTEAGSDLNDKVARRA